MILEHEMLVRFNRVYAGIMHFMLTVILDTALDFENMLHDNVYKLPKVVLLTQNHFSMNYAFR